jgi:hypothetical protein
MTTSTTMQAHVWEKALVLANLSVVILEFNDHLFKVSVKRNLDKPFADAYRQGNEPSGSIEG